MKSFVRTLTDCGIFTNGVFTFVATEVLFE
jgi:hypothetical protein